MLRVGARNLRPCRRFSARDGSILLLDTEAWRGSALLRRLWPTVRDVHHISDPQLIVDAMDPFEVAVVVMRDPLQPYLSAIGYMKALSGKVQVLAIFAGGELPAHYSLMAPASAALTRFCTIRTTKTSLSMRC